MPSRPCKWPTCCEYVPREAEYCPEHAEQGRKLSNQRFKYYNQHLRDAESTKFYHSAAWQKARRIKLRDAPVCQRCQREWAAHVHHIKPLRRCSKAEKTAQSNLMAVCGPCHGLIEQEARASG